MADIFVLRRYLWLLLCLGLLFGGVRSASAQTPPPTPTDPLVALTTRIEKLEDPNQQMANQIAWWGGLGAGLFTILSGIGTIAALIYGYSNRQIAKQLEKHLKAAEQKFDERLNKTIYRLDPTAITVWIEPELRKVSRLEELGFKNVKHFESASLHGSDTKNMAGVIVFEADNLNDIRHIYEQLKTHKLLDGRIGVVFCSAKRIDDAEKVLLGALPYSFANAPATIAINVINVAHLVNLRLSQPQEGAQI